MDQQLLLPRLHGRHCCCGASGIHHHCREEPSAAQGLKCYPNHGRCGCRCNLHAGPRVLALDAISQPWNHQPSNPGRNWRGVSCLQLLPQLQSSRYDSLQGMPSVHSGTRPPLWLLQQVHWGLPEVGIPLLPRPRLPLFPSPHHARWVPRHVELIFTQPILLKCN